MPFKYDKLWKMLEERNMSKDELRFKVRSSQTTIVKMGKNENISLDIIDRICKFMKCTPNDIMEYFPFEQASYSPIIRKKGDIFLYEMPMSRHSIEAGETATGYSRVCLLFQNDNYINDLPVVTIIPFSSQMSLVPSSMDVVIQPDEFNNFENPSVLKINELRRMQRGALREKCGQLSVKDIGLVNRACAEYFGL